MEVQSTISIYTFNVEHRDVSNKSMVQQCPPRSSSSKASAYILCDPLAKTFYNFLLWGNWVLLQKGHFHSTLRSMVTERQT